MEHQKKFLFVSIDALISDTAWHVLKEGNKVKVSVRFRGREASHSDLGHALLKQIIDLIGNSGIVEQNAKMEGKILSLIFGPGAKGAKKVATGSRTASSKTRGDF